MSNGSLCPWCGAYGTSSCDLEDEMGCCPWVESGEYDDEDEFEANKLGTVRMAHAEAPEFARRAA